MRSVLFTASLAALLATAGCVNGGNYSYGGRTYASRQECLDAKKRDKTTGTVVGALGGAATGAILGGNVGETALAAGVGAAGGNVLSGRNRPC
jgi:hypothetical protein